MRRLIFISLFVCTFNANSQQRVGVGTLNPDPSAQLELSSDSKGVLIPRMTSTLREMIPNPTNGLLVYDTDTDGFWYFDGVQWVQPLGPIGPIGGFGTTGPTGPQGPQGPTGLALGPQGPQGVMGITGPQGLQGPTGPAGAQGAMGIVGVLGATGPQGQTGVIGPQGIPGVLGAQGPQGLTGTQGVVGITGAVGPLGPAGTLGPTGPMGPPSFNTSIDFANTGFLSVTDPQSILNAQQGAWLTSGNSGTNPSADFVGTLDNQDLKVSTNNAERMRLLSNGDVWVDGVKPFLLRRFFCNNCDNPNRNSGVSTNDYTALIAGFYPTGDGGGDSESTRARVYANGGTWWFKGDLESVDDEDWSIDILFVKNQIADDQRPGSGNGGGTGF